jgi:hypothetical protein
MPVVELPVEFVAVDAYKLTETVPVRTGVVNGAE